jgi:transposase
MKFDKGDQNLIRELIADGMRPKEVANKWGVHLTSLRRFCKHYNIELRSNEEIECDLVKQVIKLHSNTAPDVIARLVKRSERKVKEIIRQHCTTTYDRKHIQRRDAVAMLAEAQGISLTEACKVMGLRYGEFDYSRRVANRAQKKAANK